MPFPIEFFPSIYEYDLEYFQPKFMCGHRNRRWLRRVPAALSFFQTYWLKAREASFSALALHIVG